MEYQLVQHQIDALNAIENAIENDIENKTSIIKMFCGTGRCKSTW